MSGFSPQLPAIGGRGLESKLIKVSILILTMRSDRLVRWCILRDKV